MCLIKVSLVCYLLTQVIIKKQNDLVKSLAGSGDGERLLSVEELMTSSQNKYCQSSNLCLVFLPAALCDFQDLLREWTAPLLIASGE